MARWRDLVCAAGCNIDEAVVGGVELTAALLRIAARYRDQTRVDYGDATISTERDAFARAVNALLARHLGSIPCEYFSRAVADELCDLLERSNLNAGISALLAAHALDARLGCTFVDAFRARDGDRMKPGDPVPIIRFPAARLGSWRRKQILSAVGPPTSNPRNRVEAFDRTDHLRLAPDAVADLRVTYMWIDPWLDSIGPETRLAIGVTNHAPIADDFDWNIYMAGAQPCFYGVTPQDPDEQRRRIVEILEVAIRERAEILVLPELCLTRALLDELARGEWFAKLPLVVAGSLHEPRPAGAAGVNACEVFLDGERILTHHKFSDFHYEEGGTRWHEHLERQPGTSGFHLLVGPHCTAIVLICKDCFGDVRALIKALAPNLVLIPAMSEDTSELEMLATELAHDPQAFTIVACAGPGHNLVFGRPNKIRPSISKPYASPTVVILGPRGILMDGEQRVN